MTIRTVIEVTGEDDSDHRRQLHATLDRLGFAPKASEDHVNWMRDLYEVLDEQGIDFRKLIADKQRKRFDERMT